MTLGFGVYNLTYCYRDCSPALANLSFCLFGFSWNPRPWPSMPCTFLDHLWLFLLSLGFLTSLCQSPLIHLLLLGGGEGIFLHPLTSPEHQSCTASSFLDFPSPLSPWTSTPYDSQEECPLYFPTCSSSWLISLFGDSSSAYCHPAIKSWDLLQLPSFSLPGECQIPSFLPKWQSVEYRVPWSIATVTLRFRASYSVTWIPGISFQTQVPKSELLLSHPKPVLHTVVLVSVLGNSVLPDD